MTGASHRDLTLHDKKLCMNTITLPSSHWISISRLRHPTTVAILIALTLGYTVGGAIQVETVFSWPGIGRLMYDAVQKRDYPVLQGTFLLLAVSVIFANLLAEILYTVLDPRVKAE